MDKLPPLKKILDKKEQKQDPAIRKWLEKNWKKSFAYELKIKGNNLLDHQKRALWKVKKGHFVARFSDSAVGKIPFDGFGLVDADALVIIYDPETKIYQITVLNTYEQVEVKL